MNQVKTVTIERYENGELTITEKQTYKRIFEFDKDAAERIFNRDVRSGTAVIKAGNRGYMFTKTALDKITETINGLLP